MHFWIWHIIRVRIRNMNKFMWCTHAGCDALVCTSALLNTYIDNCPQWCSSSKQSLSSLYSGVVGALLLTLKFYIWVLVKVFRPYTPFLPSLFPDSHSIFQTHLISSDKFFKLVRYCHWHISTYHKYFISNNDNFLLSSLLLLFLFNYTVLHVIVKFKNNQYIFSDMFIKIHKKEPGTSLRKFFLWSLIKSGFY